MNLLIIKLAFLVSIKLIKLKNLMKSFDENSLPAETDSELGIIFYLAKIINDLWILLIITQVEDLFGFSFI